MSVKVRLFSLIASVLFVFVHGMLFATTPVITAASPKNNSTSESPVHFEAIATSSECAKGISAMRVYSASGVTAYTVGGGKLDAYLNLTAGTYDTTIVAWDNCGGTASANVTVTASGQSKIGGFVYIVSSGYDYGNDTNNVVGFSIVAKNGALAPLLQGPVNTNVFPNSVASDKGGHRLYVGDLQSGDVFPYLIDRANGYLTPVPGAPFPVQRSVTAVAVHPSGDYVYAAASEQAPGDGIAVFRVQSDGSLAEISGSPFPTQTGPQALTVDPSGNYLYVADYSNYIEVFQINRSTGALTEASGSPFAISIPASCEPGTGATVNPTDIIDFSGKWIYTTDEFIGYVSGWFSSTPGGLTPISGSPFIENGGCAGNPYNAGPMPWSLAVDGTGKFLYVNNSNSIEGLVTYSIAANGALTYLRTTGSSTSGGQFPIRTDSTGDYLYAAGGYTAGGGNAVPAGCCYGAIVGYSINHTTGEITELPASPFIYTQPAATESGYFAVTP